MTSLAAEALSDVWVTTVTPFRSDGSLDLDAAYRHASWLVEQGVKILVPAGNTGEFSSLTAREIGDLTQAVVRAAGERASVFTGVGWSTSYAIDMGERAVAAGAQGVMVHHPAHTYMSTSGLRGYYETIARALDVPIAVYKRGPQLSDDLLTDLVEQLPVVAVKYAIPNPSAFTKVVSKCRADVVWICGVAERWAPFFHLGGARGFSSGIANFMPQQAAELQTALRNGPYEEAMKLRSRFVAFEDLRETNDGAFNVPAVKEAMAQLGLGSRAVREPLSELDQRSRDQVSRLLGTLGLAPA